MHWRHAMGKQWSILHERSRLLTGDSHAHPTGTQISCLGLLELSCNGMRLPPRQGVGALFVLWRQMNRVYRQNEFDCFDFCTNSFIKFSEIWWNDFLNIPDIFGPRWILWHGLENDRICGCWLIVSFVVHSMRKRKIWYIRSKYILLMELQYG